MDKEEEAAFQRVEGERLCLGDPQQGTVDEVWQGRWMTERNKSEVEGEKGRAREGHGRGVRTMGVDGGPAVALGWPVSSSDGTARSPLHGAHPIVSLKTPYKIQRSSSDRRSEASRTQRRGAEGGGRRGKKTHHVGHCE